MARRSCWSFEDTTELVLILAHNDKMDTDWIWNGKHLMDLGGLREPFLWPTKMKTRMATDVLGTELL